jgi:hypothetical protein
MSAEAVKHTAPEAAAEKAPEASEAHGESAEVASVQEGTRSSMDKFKQLFFDTPEEKALKAEKKAHEKAAKAAKKQTLKAERKSLRSKIVSGAWSTVKGFFKGATAPVWWPTKQTYRAVVWAINAARAIPHTTLWKGLFRYPFNPSSYKLRNGGGGHGGGGH